MESGLENASKKWSAPTCPADEILSALLRKLNKSKEGNLTIEGLDNEGDIGNGRLIYLFYEF
jgi:hypothetical protein